MVDKKRKRMLIAAINKLHEKLGDGFRAEPLFLDITAVELMGFDFRGAHASIDLQGICQDCNSPEECLPELIEETIDEMELIHTDVEDAIHFLKHLR